MISELVSIILDKSPMVEDEKAGYNLGEFVENLARWTRGLRPVFYGSPNLTA